MLGARQGEVDQLGARLLGKCRQLRNRADYVVVGDPLPDVRSAGAHDSHHLEAVVRLHRHFPRDPLRQLSGPDDQDVAKVSSPASERAQSDADRQVGGAERARPEDREEKEDRARQLAPPEVRGERRKRRHDRDPLDESPELLGEARGSRGAVQVEGAEDEERERRDDGAEPNVAFDRRDSERRREAKPLESHPIGRDPRAEDQHAVEEEDSG